MKKKSGKTYLKSLTKISDWALENCIDDQLPKAIELRNKIETVHLSCQKEDYDQHVYPRLIGNYRRDLNTLLSNYKESFSFHSPNLSNTSNPTQIEGQKYSKPCMLCDNLKKTEFVGC